MLDTSARLRLPDTGEARPARGRYSMPAPRLALFLNPWGASSFSRHLPTLLAEARKHGYDGVEMSLSDLGPDPAARRATCDMISDHGMRLILGLYSGWAIMRGRGRRARPARTSRSLSSS